MVSVKANLLSLTLHPRHVLTDEVAAVDGRSPQTRSVCYDASCFTVIFYSVANGAGRGGEAYHLFPGYF